MTKDLARRDFLKGSAALAGAAAVNAFSCVEIASRVGWAKAASAEIA